MKEVKAQSQVRERDDMPLPTQALRNSFQRRNKAAINNKQHGN